MSDPTCPTCHGSGYISDGGDCVTQCDDPACGYQLVREGEALFRQIPQDSLTAQEAYVMRHGPTWTRRQVRALNAYVATLPRRTPAQMREHRIRFITAGGRSA